MLTDLIDKARDRWNAWRLQREIKAERARIRFLGDVHRLQLKDGDVLVLSCDGHISDETAYRLKAAFESRITGVETIVLGEGMRVGLLNINRTQKD